MLLHSRSAPALRRLLPISRIKEVLLMMPATEKEFIRDYIERTKLNYERLKAGPYEVTQLINSAIGLLIIPEQKLYDKITNKLISKQLLNELIVHIQINTYDKQPNLKIIARHLRNSVAHARLELKAQEQPEFDKPLLIESVIFRDEDGEKSFQIELPIETLEQFFYAFSDAAASL